MAFICDECNKQFRDNIRFLTCKGCGLVLCEFCDKKHDCGVTNL